MWVTLATYADKIVVMLSPISGALPPAVNMVNIGGHPAAHATKATISVDGKLVLLTPVFSQSCTLFLLLCLTGRGLWMGSMYHKLFAPV